MKLVVMVGGVKRINLSQLPTELKLHLISEKTKFSFNLGKSFGLVFILPRPAQALPELQKDFFHLVTEF